MAASTRTDWWGVPGVGVWALGFRRFSTGRHTNGLNDLAGWMPAGQVARSAKCLPHTPRGDQSAF
jgi:hypothetical protein